MMITKEANGTINYGGAAFDILNFYAEALNIRYDRFNIIDLMHQLNQVLSI